MMVIDQVDDLQVPWQQTLHHVGSPSFQSLRENGVVGVRIASIGNLPCLKKKHKALILLSCNL